MPETYAYTADRQARLVLAGWMTNAVVYSSVGGKSTPNGGRDEAVSSAFSGSCD
jgi:hypothetical protein